VTLITMLVLSAPILYRTDRAIDPIFEDRVDTVVESVGGPALPEAVPIALPNWERKERVNILLLGLDQREGEEFGRTDTMILASVDPVARRVGMMSLPRDLKVDIPGYGPAKLNAAYVFGQQEGEGTTPDERRRAGVRLLKRTVTRNFDVPVHYYAQVDFRGFERVIDEFGGVNVDAPYPIVDKAYPTETFGYTAIYFAAGLQHLNGKQALRYARTRHADNDFARARRQQEVLFSLQQQALNRKLASKFYPLLAILGDSVKTDLSKENAAALVSLGQGFTRDNIKSQTIQDLVEPVVELDEEGNEIEYLVPTWSQVRKRVREMVPSPGTATGSAPDPAAKIGVRNGTLRAGFAARSTDRLKAAGFAGAVIDPTDITGAGQGPQPRTIIYDWGGRGDAAGAAARALGLTDAVVRDGTGPAPGGVDILIVLGGDAPDLPPRR